MALVLVVSACSGSSDSAELNRNAQMVEALEATTTLAPVLTQAPTTTVPMPRGTPDPEIAVTTYVPDKVWLGTTLFADNHTPGRPRIVEVNMLGEIIWEYLIPEELSQYTNPGFDVEALPGGNVLFVLPTSGVYEVDRDGNTVWSLSLIHI